MNRTLYTLLFHLGLPLVALRLFLRSRKAPAYAQRVGERFALGLPVFKKSGQTDSNALGFNEAVEAFERNLLGAALERHAGNLSQAAQALGLAKTTLFDKVKKYGL